MTNLSTTMSSLSSASGQLLSTTTDLGSALLHAGMVRHNRTEDFNGTTHNWLAMEKGDGKNFFHHLMLKDETVFVALIVMGIIVPAIFITVFALICIKRKKEVQARRTQMLLRNAQDLAMEDYNSNTHTATRPPLV